MEACIKLNRGEKLVGGGMKPLGGTHKTDHPKQVERQRETSYWGLGGESPDGGITTKGTRHRKMVCVPEISFSTTEGGSKRGWIESQE